MSAPGLLKAIDLNVAVEFIHYTTNNCLYLRPADFAIDADLHGPVGGELRRITFLHRHYSRAAALAVALAERLNSLLDDLFDLNPPQELLRHG